MDSGVWCEDSLEWLGRQADESVDLVYIDPPFNTGRQKRTVDADAPRYADHWPGGMSRYVAFLAPRLEQARRVLKDSGTLYVHQDWRAVHYVRVVLDELFGSGQFLNEIIWHYRTGGVSQRWFGRKHDTILVYAKQRGQHTFHVQRGGQFRTDGLLFDDDGRPYKTTRAGRLYFHADGPALSDVWDIPFLSTVSRERCGYPSQKPLALLERIISASSNPQDVVADAFCGSGTTLVAARRLGRRWLGCDINPQAVDITRQRLAAAVEYDTNSSPSAPG